MRARLFAIAAYVIAVIAAASTPVLAAVPEYGAVIVKTYPHDPDAFTEGLLYHNGFLYEGTGLNGRSAIRKVVLETGQVVQQHEINAQYFGEGIVDWQDTLLELTWKSGVGFVYKLGTFTPVADFRYDGEGWGLTRDASRIIMSDGTSDIRFLDPATLREVGRIHVTCDGRPIDKINELEWVKDEIYANIWLTMQIVRIDPKTGHIVGLVAVGNLLALASANRQVDVANGIAYDAASDRLFVTGKLWPTLYQITPSQQPVSADGCHNLP